MTCLSPIQRWWKKVHVTDSCWIWTGAKIPQGYGQLSVDGATEYAHQFAYITFVGPTGDEHVLHHCDNPSCVRPDHLFLGTNADNVADKISKGRGRAVKGEEHPAAKITRQQADEIQQASGVKLRVLAEKYKLAISTICEIRKGRLWRCGKKGG